MRFVLFFLILASVQANELVVRDVDSLKAALRDLRSGTTLKIAPGDYPGGHHVVGIANLTIDALDVSQPPHFKSGKTAWQFSQCDNLTLRHLRISGQTENGLNLDDGAKLTQPVKGITLDHLEVTDIGPSGNHDAIKCSGLDSLTIRDCLISGWGGQGIDFVGCHDSLISGCQFMGKDGFTATAGIQLKGGSRNVIIEKCTFKNAGERPINLGGSTDLPFFRPAAATYEAKDLIVRDCEIEGSSCAAAFVGVDGALFTRNTILFPDKWVFRILQETTGKRFVACRNVQITENKILFRRSQVQIEINIGSDTAPETFTFKANHWTAEDKPEKSRPKLPVEESDAVYGQDFR